MSTQSCNLCNLEFKNDIQLKQHLEGKRHKKIESIKEEREKSAKKSLFVSGLRKDTLLKQLEEHFIQFGRIHKIIVDQEKNAYAIIEYENEESVDKALNYNGEHRVDEKNLKVSRRQLKEFVSRIANNGEKKKELLEKLKEEALKVNIILGKCETFDDQVDKLINYLKLDDKELQLRKFVCQALNEIFKKFWSENECQVKIFGSTENDLACKGSDMDMTLLLEDYLKENRLKQLNLPQIVVKQLKQSNKQSNGGQDSSDSNLGTEPIETEMDENVDLDNVDDDEEKSDLSLKESILKFFNDKDYKSFVKFDVEHQIKIIARIVQRFLIDLKNLKTITNTRCPVVNFFHNKANVNCDLSLNNFLAVENTKLIKLYMDLEPNLKKMVFVLRYWFRHKNLYSSSRFNSYTIIWMIIFYMQSNNIGYLPSVEKLSFLSNASNKIHGWECSFEQDIQKIMAHKPAQKISKIDVNCFNDLLKGFFEFYSKFKFSTPDAKNHIIISTRDSKILVTSEKEHLSKITDIINIQDPFDLSHNLSANISRNTLEKFQSECTSSNELLQFTELPRRALNKSWGLMLLMTKKALPINHSTTSPTKELVEKSLLSLKIADNNEIKDIVNKKNGDEKLQVQKSIDFVLFLLRDCLMFEKLEGDNLIIKQTKRLRALNQICDQVDSMGLTCSPKRLKVASNSSSDPNKPTQTYVCVFDENNNGNKANNENEEICDNENENINAKIISSHQFRAKQNTWHNRRAIKRELKQKSISQVDEIELEKMTSQKLMTLNCDNLREIAFKIDFLRYDDIQSNIKIKFGLLNETQNQNDLIEFTTLVHFLDIYINNCKERLYNIWENKTISSN